MNYTDFIAFLPLIAGFQILGNIFGEVNISYEDCKYLGFSSGKDIFILTGGEKI